VESTPARYAAAFAILAALACPASAQVAATAGPAAQSAVGPIPGPGEEQPRPNPLAGNAGARATGRQLFLAYNCAGCHGDHAGGGMGPSLRDEVWIYGGNDADVFD
jgi:cytochrome c oxidase cbb3-type subunit 3